MIKDAIGQPIEVGDEVAHVGVFSGSAYLTRREIVEIKDGKLRLDGERSRCNVKPINVVAIRREF